MNFQILPNWCKNLGIFMFIVFSCLHGYDDFISGFRDARNGSAYEYPKGEYYEVNESAIFSLEKEWGENMMFLFGALALAGILIYMLSREKIEDEYINKLRLESYQLSFIFVSLLIFVLYLCGISQYMEELTVITFLLEFYLIIFAIRKRTV